MGKIGFGGGCHWCTEAVFQSLKGILKVEQGFISPIDPRSSFSEAVIVHYDHKVISLRDLIEVHLLTHNSTSNHSMRDKYRSAIYTFNTDAAICSKRIVLEFQTDFGEKIITQVLPFGQFKPSDSRFHNYYYNNPEKPFCEAHITPKLLQLRKKNFEKLNIEKLSTKGVLK